ncbi:MAG: ABC transporter ATP-binding protein [Ruminococcus sp.]|nr:ABC transporter ATP-binding protein [Ruminococcus sp.]
MKKEKKPSAFSRLMEYAGSYKTLTYISWILSFLSALTALLPLVYIFFIIREVLAVAPDFSKATSIVHNGVMAVVFSAIALVVYIGSLMCSHVSAFSIGSNIKRRLLKHISKLPLGLSDEIGSGKLRKIINDSSTAAETYLAHNLPDMAGAVATPLGMVVMMFVVDWRFGLVSILPIILAFLCMGKMIGPAMKEDMRLYNNALEDMNNEAVEYVRGIPVVKTFGQTVHSFSRFKTSIQNYYKFCIAYTKRCRQPMLFFLLFINSAFAFLIALALILSNGGANVTSNIILNFLFYVIITPVIVTTMQRVMFMSEGNMTVADAFDRIDSVLDRKPFENTEKNTTPDDYSVAFENVSFSYDGENLALDNVSFEVKSGTSLALVGPSGGGKTTVAGLIARFWDVKKGAVRIGGVNVKDIPKEELMNTVSYVFQDSKLLKRSILENVRLSRPDATEQEVMLALEKAQCMDIIEKLPDGVNTVIGAKGVYLSGGEQQRIAIARAILKNAPIVVLDEATAFADPENEYLVQNSFKELSKNKTVIMIAHRLSTIQGCDNIIVLENGRISEQGVHGELLKKDGIYNKMWKDYQSSVSWKVGENNA